MHAACEGLFCPVQGYTGIKDHPLKTLELLEEGSNDKAS